MISEGETPATVRRHWQERVKYEGTLQGDARLIRESRALRYGPGAGTRDEHAERMLRSHYRPNKVVVCVGGMAHMVDSRSKLTLYSRIKDLNPQRIPLF